jgi:hypothetical protein
VTDDTRRLPVWRASVPRLSQFAVEQLLLLPIGAVIALVWANGARAGGLESENRSALR